MKYAVLVSLTGRNSDYCVWFALSSQEIQEILGFRAVAPRRTVRAAEWTPIAESPGKGLERTAITNETCNRRESAEHAQSGLPGMQKRRVAVEIYQLSAFRPQ